MKSRLVIVLVAALVAGSSVFAAMSYVMSMGYTPMGSGGAAGNGLVGTTNPNVDVVSLDQIYNGRRLQFCGTGTDFQNVTNGEVFSLKIASGGAEIFLQRVNTGQLWAAVPNPPETMTNAVTVTTTTAAGTGSQPLNPNLQAAGDVVAQTVGIGAPNFCWRTGVY